MCAGESFKKAIRSGRLKASDFKRPVGQTKKQSVLVPLAESAEIVSNFKRIFLTAVGAEYCASIDPPIEEGTMGVLAVIAFLQQKKVFAKVMHHVKQKYSRLTNKKFLSTEACKILQNWVREKDSEDRLRCLR